MLQDVRGSSVRSDEVSLAELFCGNITNILKHTSGSVQLYQDIIALNKLDIELYMHALDLYCKSFMKKHNALCSDSKFHLYYRAFLTPGSDYFQVCDDISNNKVFS